MNQTTLNIDNFFDGIDLNVTITRAKFETLCEDDFKRCFEPVERVIKDAHTKDSSITKDSITDIVLVGGSTRIPKIRQMVKDYFGKDPKVDINPDEAVAYGAAVQGAVLSGIKDATTGALVLVDVTPLSLGIETAGGVMSFLIRRNSTIPIEKDETFSTFSDNQPGVTVKVYEGEREMTKHNNLLGTFELHGIPPAPRGIPKIKVKFAIDTNGIMNVTAKEEGTGKENKLVITNNKGRLTKEQLATMYSEAEKFADDDKKIREKIDAKNSFESYLHSIRNTTSSLEFKTLVGDDMYKNLQDTVTSCIQWLDDNGQLLTTTKQHIEDKYKEAETKILPIIKLSYEKKKTSAI